MSLKDLVISNLSYEQTMNIPVYDIKKLFIDMSEIDFLIDKLKRGWDLNNIPKYIKLIKSLIKKINLNGKCDKLITPDHINDFINIQHQLFSQVLKNPQYIDEYNSLREFYLDIVENETDLHINFLYFMCAPFHVFDPDIYYKIHSDKDSFVLKFLNIDIAILYKTGLLYHDCPFQPYIDGNYQILAIKYCEVKYTKDPQDEFTYYREYGKIPNVSQKYFLTSDKKIIKKIDCECEEHHGHAFMDGNSYST